MIVTIVVILRISEISFQGHLARKKENYIHAEDSQLPL